MSRAALTAAIGCASGTLPSIAGPVDFNRDVRPILSDNCFACHGPDSGKVKGGLRLDVADAAIKGGETDGPAISPGRPEESALIRRVLSRDPDDLMPPPDSAKHRLSEAQVSTLRQWITEGAVYQGHWAFGPPARPTVPAVATPGGPLASPIDAFIAARLEKEGLAPAAEADRATLIRRATLDLTGLPPTPDEVDAFLSDASPQAWEKVIDRLLASPHYGETMALPWLDMARFADSNGYQTDSSRSMWPWRDWVIAAFNKNMPFDQFTIEQLAGDLLPNPSRDQLVASGFNRNHRLNGEGGLIQAEWFVETVIDRVETTGSTWMALTLNCCRCHDHKYDPVSQKEFYSLYAYFNSVEESGILEGDARNTPPLLRLPTPEQEAKLARLKEEVTKTAEAVTDAEAQLAQGQPAWETGLMASLGEPPAWSAVRPVALVSENGSQLTLEENDTLFAGGGPQPDTDVYTLTLKPHSPVTTALRLELLPDDRLPSKGPGRHTNGNPIVSEITLDLRSSPGKSTTRLPWSRVVATFDQPGWESPKAIDANPATGWAIHPNVGQPQSAIFVLAEPLHTAPDAELIVSIIQNYGAGATIGKLRISLTDSPTPTPLPDPVTTALRKPLGDRTEAEAAALVAFRRQQAPEMAAAVAAADRATRALGELEASFPTAMVMKELAQPREARVLHRGEYDQPGDAVPRQLPAFLPALPASEPNDRLGLARWLVSGSHPLTARVWVNRTWEKFFGTGLCRTSENFGSQSEWPSHPELLDWLATEFVRLGWDMKALQKEIVLSATYRQSARVSPELYARDPENRLLARGPRFRLKGEILRDQALAVAGLLKRQLGGPSVRPYMPDGVWDETSRYGDLRGYRHETGDSLYRRTMYTIWKRSAGPPTLALFDGPNRDVCTVKRSRTNTPTQALAMLNEVTFVEAARVFAARILNEGGATPEDRFTWAMRQLVARPPTSTELKVLTNGLAARRASFEASPDKADQLLGFGETRSPDNLPPAELTAWTLMANVLMNLDEFVTRE